MELRKESSRVDNKVTINAKSILFRDLAFLFPRVDQSI